MITEEDKDRIIATLTLQLQDKEKEIENYEHELEVYKQNDNVYAKNMNRLASRHNQDKIDFAVEQLEKMKENLIEDLYPFYSRPCTIYKVYGDMYEDFLIDNINNIIDNQITKLKEGK